jgi:hypothetical protein
MMANRPGEPITIADECRRAVLDLEAALGHPVLFFGPQTTWQRCEYVCRVADQGRVRDNAVRVLVHLAERYRITTFNLITAFPSGVSPDGFPQITLEWRGTR